MKILLGVTGSVATTLVSKLISQLESAGHEVQVVATKWSLYFFEPADLSVRVWRDEDEWSGAIYEKNQPIPHIDLREWADLLLIAPLSANTLAKMANGLCDNLLTSVARAWSRDKPLVVAPAMNTVMWEHPATEQHLDQLQVWFRFRAVRPIAKRLACGDEGIGALARLDDIVEAVNVYR